MEPAHRNGVIPARKPSTEEVARLTSASRSITIAAASVFFRETQGHRDEVTIIRSLPSVTAGEWHPRRQQAGTFSSVNNRVQARPDRLCSGRAQYASLPLHVVKEPAARKKYQWKFAIWYRRYHP